MTASAAMPTNPQAILFDLDGTLWDRNAAVRALVGEQHTHLHAELGHIPRETYVARVVQLDDNGRADKNVLYRVLGAEFGLDGPTVATLHADFWSRFERFTHPFPEAIATLLRLKRAGIRLGIITNGTIRVQEAKIDRLGLAGVMDVVLISEREGVRKPDPEIFHRALARLTVPASDAWFVGDNPEVDIEGARSAGLRPFWRRCDDWPSPSAAVDTIRTLDELLSLVSPL